MQESLESGMLIGHDVISMLHRSADLGADVLLLGADLARNTPVPEDKESQIASAKSARLYGPYQRLATPAALNKHSPACPVLARGFQSEPAHLGA